MFVSNFEETVERAARQYEETMTRLSVAEEGWSQAQRQAVAVLKKLGLSAAEISQQLSLSQEEIETNM
jgi:DNA-directed RNA polymerase specialized sigma24 family protein